jgi:hypothetical protein
MPAPGYREQGQAAPGRLRRAGFVDWLNAFRRRAERWTEADFAPRKLYGDHLEGRLRNLCGRTPGLGSTRCMPRRRGLRAGAGTARRFRLLAAKLFYT